MARYKIEFKLWEVRVGFWQTCGKSEKIFSAKNDKEAMKKAEQKRKKFDIYDRNGLIDDTARIRKLSRRGKTLIDNLNPKPSLDPCHYSVR